MLRQYTRLWVWSPWKVFFFLIIHEKQGRGPQRHIPSCSWERNKERTVHDQVKKASKTVQIQYLQTHFRHSPLTLASTRQLAALVRLCQMEASATVQLLWSKRFDNAPLKLHRVEISQPDSSCICSEGATEKRGSPKQLFFVCKFREGGWQGLQGNTEVCLEQTRVSTPQSTRARYHIWLRKTRSEGWAAFASLGGKLALVLNDTNTRVKRNGWALPPTTVSEDWPIIHV